jgi:uncharacterized membrane protein YhaH (DUF805 family)
MHWMILPLQRYAEFSGRSTRREYWFFQLFYVLALILSFLVHLWPIFMLAMIVPMLAVTVRRMHDHDKSGWFLLLSLVPFIGGLIVMAFMVMPGTDGENSFGQDPRGPSYDRLQRVFE